MEEIANEIREILSRGKVLTGRDWERVRLLVHKAVPGEWFGVAIFKNGGIVLPLVFVHGASRDVIERLLRIQAEAADLMNALVENSARPTRLRDYITRVMSEEEGYALFEKSRYYREVLEPEGIYYLLRVPLILDGEKIGELKVDRARRWGEFTDGEVEFLAGLQPDLTAAVSRSREQMIKDDPYIGWNMVFASKGLSQREREVALHIVKGRSNTEIALELGISVYTVKEHAKKIFKKLDIKRRSQIFNLKP